MVGMVSILAGIAPGDVHLARRQVDHQRIDSFFPVERIVDAQVMFADGIRVIDMVTLDSLQRLDRMFI